jgi:hypothetical protein
MQNGPKARRTQFSLARLCLGVAAISMALAIFRLPEPLCIGLMVLVGSIICARLGNGFGETVLLGMYGSLAAVWVAVLGNCLVTMTWSFDWPRALLASWLCAPLGVWIGLVVARFQHDPRRYVAISKELAKRRRDGGLL